MPTVDILIVGLNKHMTNVDLETMRLFVGRLSRLRQTRLARLMREPGLTVEIWERPDGQIEPVLPQIDQDDLDAFILNWRLFTQKNERISVRCLSDLVVSADIPQELRAGFSHARDDLNAHLDSKPTIPLAGTSTNRDFLDTMLYGFFAHLAVEKHELGLGWEKSLGKEELRLLFVTALEEAMKKLEGLRRPVELIIHHVENSPKNI